MYNTTFFPFTNKMWVYIIHCYLSVWCDQSKELITGSLDAVRRKQSQSKELSKRLFISPAGSWTAVSPTGGNSSVWQTYRRTEPGERPGTGSGGGSILVEKWLAPGAGWPLQRQRGEITQSDALCHTPVEEQAEAGRGGPLLKSCRCLQIAFMWMGGLNRRCVTALSSEWSSSVGF